MPRYSYKCGHCHVDTIFFLRIGQEPSECPSCGEGDKMQKQFASSFSVKNKNTVAIGTEQPVGVLTKEYIEENRRILEEEKKLAKEEEYEPS